MSTISWIILVIVVLVIVVVVVFVVMNRRAEARRARAEQIRQEATERAAELDRKEAEANAMAAQTQDARAEANRLESVSAERRAESAAARIDVEDSLRKGDHIDPDVERRSRDVDDASARHTTDETSDEVDVRDRAVRDETIRDEAVREQDAATPPSIGEQYFAAPGQMTGPPGAPAEEIGEEPGGEPVPSKKVEKVSNQASHAGIFLSYRREDVAPYARLLQFQLAERFPTTRVFLDLDSIEAGLDFAEVIRNALSSSAVLVALIGRQWTSIVDEDGRRRLDSADDYVRYEIQTALERGLRVIPVLVDGAKPLKRQDLPAQLQGLTRLNVLELSYGRYQYDAERLLAIIERVLAAVPSSE